MPLLDWLGVQRRHRYARASALDEGEASLTGMLLLDLPDHDSVVTGSAALVDRLVKMADMDIKAADMITTADAAKASAFSRSSPDLALRSARAVGAWQDHLTRLTEGEDLRPAVRRVSFDEEALGLVVLVAMLGEAVPAGAGSAAAAPGEAGGGSVYTEPREMLTSVFGAVMLTEILAKARADLTERVRLLLDEELVRFVEVIDAAGDCDDVAAIRLYQAEFSLEAVR